MRCVKRVRILAHDENIYTCVIVPLCMQYKQSIEIIYEDEVVLVVHKPSGLAVHEDGRNNEPVLTDWIRATYPDVVGVGEPMRLQNGTMIDRPGIVHRLDKETSGVLIIAKTQGAFLHLKRQFQARTVQKEYRAFVVGNVTKQTGTIDLPIGRSKNDFRRWSAGKDVGGTVREAVTRFTTLISTQEASYLSLEPKTGRTHQLRVHLRAIGHPIICDTRYNNKPEPLLGFQRLALHAHAITFVHPTTGITVVCEAPLPEDFVRAEKVICG
jgi:23S rRNA pseudouridine1911/1915/1917 synthase